MNIPNLPMGPITNSDGSLTDNYRIFFDSLIKELQTNASNEGLVAPTQNASNITLIQNNQLPAPNSSYTCQFGTSIYNSTANSIMFAVDDGAGAPLFKTVTLT